MKIVLIFHILFSFMSSSLMADDLLINLKKMQLSLDKNNPEMTEEIYDVNEASLSNNWMALEKLALSFERRNKYKEAIGIYRKIITKFNLSAHQNILAAQSEKVSETLYQSNKLPYHYYKLAFLNAQLFSSSNNFMPPQDRIRFKKNAEGYIQLLRKVNTEDEEIKLIEELIQGKIKVENELTYKKNWYVFFHFISWQDRVYLQNQTTMQKTPLLSTVIGTSLGLGKKWNNARYEFNVEGMYTNATSTTSSSDSSITYLQPSVPITSIIVGPGMYYKGFSEKVFVGLQLPFSYRTGTWEAPEDYELVEDKLIGAGYFFQVKFQAGPVFIQSRLGKIFPNPGSHWSIGALYDF